MIDQLRLIEMLQHAQLHPSMMGLRRTYESASSYLLGMDAAQGGALLAGFTPWLIDRFGLSPSHANLAWFCIVAREICPERWDKTGERSDADEQAIFDGTFGLAITFLNSQDESP